MATVIVDMANPAVIRTVRVPDHHRPSVEEEVEAAEETDATDPDPDPIKLKKSFRKAESFACN